ncbi:MAG: PD40 domain-containing protein [Bacteroidia bacterium]|nr:PD40 domain-containing protein [Bacteroidia bacterium]
MKIFPTIITAIFCLLWSLPVQSQEVLWADHLIDFSTEYKGQNSLYGYHAVQVLGKPNVLPQTVFSMCAWSPATQSSKENEYVQVSFPKMIQVQQILIAESQNCGAVERVLLFDENDGQHVVENPFYSKGMRSNCGMLRIQIPRTSYLVSSLTLVLNTENVEGWNHIDAIGIADSREPFEAQINLVPEMMNGVAEPLPENINSPYDEIMPVLSPDGEWLYFDRKDHPDNTPGPENDDIWVSHREADGWGDPRKMPAPLNNKGHNFVSAVAGNGNTLLLANIYLPDGASAYGVSISRRIEGGWSDPEAQKINQFYNKNKFGEYFLSNDEKVMILAIQRIDSYGAKDLYVSFREGDHWTVPLHMGPEINSANTEMGPTLAPDGKTLYFSSNGFSGYGSQDIFVSKRLDDTWTHWSEPLNLGPSVNSAGWEGYLSVDGAGEYAYFSREPDSTRGTDIFRIKLVREARPESMQTFRGRAMDGGKSIPVTVIYQVEGGAKGEVNSVLEHGEHVFNLILPAKGKVELTLRANGYREEKVILHCDNLKGKGDIPLHKK